MSPRTMLMALRGSFNDPRAEAEPVLIEHDYRQVTITLDDGDEITLDRAELVCALDAHKTQGMAA